MTMTERMQRLTALRQERAAKWDTARTFLDSKTHNGRMSEADAAAYETMEKELTDLGNDIARLERANELEAAMNAAADPILGEPRSGKAAGTGTASGMRSGTSTIPLRCRTHCRWGRILRAAIWCRTSSCACKRRCLQ